MPLREGPGLNLVLVAHIAHRHTHDQMLAQDIDFLLGCEVKSGSFLLGLHVDPTPNPISAAFPFPPEAEQPDLQICIMLKCLLII